MILVLIHHDTVHTSVLSEGQMFGCGFKYNLKSTTELTQEDKIFVKWKVTDDSGILRIYCSLDRNRLVTLIYLRPHQSLAV